MIHRILNLVKDIAQGKPAAARDGRWPALERAHLAQEPTCAACDGHLKLQVHHVLPFHLYPALELDPANLITLCRSKDHGVDCHLHYGHNGDFQKYNPNVRRDAAQCLMRLHQEEAA